jgi:hypothetical protein
MLGTFLGLGHFEAWDILRLRIYGIWDVLRLGHFETWFV